jgi:hypothetical protein
MSLASTSKTIAEKFYIIGTNEKGKQIMRCLRCAGFGDKTRGKGFPPLSFATPKGKDHIAVYCPGINPKEDNFDVNLRQTLLVNLPKGVLSAINNARLSLRKIHCVCMK